MDVAGWLQGLGLERYVPAFRDNAGGAIAGGFGKRLEPGAVLGLQRNQFGDCVVPALRPAAAIGRPTVSDHRHPGVAGSVERHRARASALIFGKSKKSNGARWTAALL